MGFELILSFFLGLLGNALTEIASTADAEKKAKIKELLAKIKEDNFIPLAVNKTLKTISVDDSEADSLKILINNDLLIKRIAQIITGDIKQDKFVKIIVQEIKKFGHFDSQKSYSFEPLLEYFAVQFYSQILANPSYAPFLIIQKIVEDGDKTREHVTNTMDEFADKIVDNLFDRLSGVPFASQTTTKQVSEAQYYGISSDIQKVRGIDKEPRTNKILIRQLESVLEKLNDRFRDQAKQVREIQKKRDFRKAIELYDSLLAGADETIDDNILFGIYSDCALCAINIDDLELADIWLKRAESLNDDDERVIAIRGLYLFEKGDKELAKRYAEKALGINKYYHIALILIAAVSLENGIECHQILVDYFFDDNGIIHSKFKPEHLPVIYRTIGQCYLNAAEIDKAIEFFLKSLELDNSDDACLSLIGHAFFRKAVGSTTDTFKVYESLPLDKEEPLRKAIYYYEEALRLAANHNTLKSHISTISNLSACHLLLGEYEKAYGITNELNQAINDSEELLRSHATAAYYKGYYTEASELLAGLNNKSTQDIINTALSEIHSGSPTSALALLDNYLENAQIAQNEKDSLAAVRFQILVMLKEKEKAKKVLESLKDSTLADWEIYTMQGSYNCLVGKHEEANKYFSNALSNPELPLLPTLFIADYYFQQKDYSRCNNICQTLKKSLPASSEDLNQYFFMAIYSSYKVEEYKLCRHLIQTAKTKGIDQNYILEISASICWYEGKYDEAIMNMNMLYDRLQDDDKKFSVLTNLIPLLTVTGDFNGIQDYYAEALQLNNFHRIDRLAINFIKAFLVFGNPVEARKIFEKALEENFDNKVSEVHKFAPTFYFRENKAELLVKYAVKFNEQHGNTEWLWKKDIKKDEKELRTIFIDGLRREKAVKESYKKYPVPFTSLPSLLGKKELIHFWRFNREYGYILNVESGDAQELTSEISLVSSKGEVIIDYLSLLAIQEVDSKLLWALDNFFDVIYVYRPLQIQIIEELISEEHNGLREILLYLSKSRKVRFVPYKPKDSYTVPKELINFIDPIHLDLIYIAKEKNACLLSCDARLKSIAKEFFKIDAVGLRAFFESAKNKGLIVEDELHVFVLTMADKDGQFISFNADILLTLFNKNTFNDASRIFSKLSSQILLNQANIDTFIRVYLDFIYKCCNEWSNTSIAQFIIERVIEDLKRLTIRTLVRLKYPSLIKDLEVSNAADSKAINTFCILFLFHILRIIHTSSLLDAVKSEMVKFVLDKFNLAHWYEIQGNKMLAVNEAIEQARRENDGDK